MYKKFFLLCNTQPELDVVTYLHLSTKHSTVRYKRMCKKESERLPFILLHKNAFVVIEIRYSILLFVSVI
uniref:Uncharacterized protein n=1 Tax=Octopus bimaculoides TaxID=37653 RepID=A0A0L8FKS2_OCTBM